jgi:hypothetical protein
MMQPKEPRGRLCGGNGGLDAGGQKIQFILQKKIIRLAFFGSFFGNEKKNKTKWMEF